MATGFSQPPMAVGGDDLAKPPLIFLGNKSLPPMIYIEGNKPVGVIVDLAEAIKSRMYRPVDIKYMNWSHAQQLVLEGKADALLQINPSEERKKLYDFSDSLVESEFSIFILSSTEGVYDINSLKGLQVGVEQKGLPIQILKRHPLIKIVVVPDILSGFYQLDDGVIDAVVVDRWVGSFIIAENNFRKIRISGAAIDKSNSAIAVKKGNAELLSDINRALAEIRGDGTYFEILARWEPKEIVFRTKDQIFKGKIILVAILCVLFILIASVFFLMFERKKRQKVVAELQKAMSEVKTLGGLLPICSSCKKIRDDKGYWEQIESYIETHSDTYFTHGYCPECYAEALDKIHETHTKIKKG